MKALDNAADFPPNPPMGTNYHTVPARALIKRARAGEEIRR